MQKCLRALRESVGALQGFVFSPQVHLAGSSGQRSRFGDEPLSSKELPEVRPRPRRATNLRSEGCNMLLPSMLLQSTTRATC